MKQSLKSLSLVLMIIILIISGCGNTQENTPTKADQADKKTTTDNLQQKDAAEKQILSIMHWSKEENIEETIRLFEEKYPNIEVELFYTDNKQYDNVLNTKLASGDGPDIIEIGANFKKLAEANRVMDLSGQEFIDRYHSSGTDWLTYEEKNYGVPWFSWMEGIFYNKELFEQAGISEVPKDWTEFIEVHRKLTEAGIKPQAMGAKSWEPLMKQSMALVISGFYQESGNENWGQDYSDGKTTMSGNWDKYIEEWSRIVTEGYLTPDMLGMEYDQAQDEFSTGKAAMWESGNWAVNTIKEKNPDLDFGFFPIPGIDGPGYLIGGAGSGWIINADTEVEDAALAFLDFWSTEEGHMPAQQSFGGGLFLKGVEAELPVNLDGAREALANGRIYVPWNEWYGAQAIIMEYGKGMQDYLANEGKDPELLEEVLKKADAKRDQMIQTK